MIITEQSSPVVQAVPMPPSARRGPDGATPPQRSTKSAKIAIIDDEPINIKVVRKYLSDDGYGNFITTSNSGEAMALLAREEPDVVLLDIMMPVVNGIEILQAIRADARLAHTPVLILTASTDTKTRLKALNAGATDFLAKPVDSSDLLPRVRNALVVKAHHDHLQNYSQELERQVRLRTQELETSRLQVVHCLARAGEYRDRCTGRHVIRVGRYAGLLARHLGFSNSAAEVLSLAAQLHDVGKIGLPDAILLKEGDLNEQEREVVKQHCEIGNRIVQPFENGAAHCASESARLEEASSREPTHPLLAMAATIAMTHHEKWNGSGYPRGLSGEQIPIEGRIVAVADVFDALTSARPYKQAFPPDQALELMRKDRGTHFDPRVFDTLVARFDEALQIHTEDADR